MFRITVLGATALIAAATASATVNTRQTLYEEAIAHEEEALIITRPIAGIENHLWFDYRTNVGEAQKELASDLRHVSDTEDLRDAWDEYRQELSHERVHYVKAMAKRGYRLPIVTVEE